MKVAPADLENPVPITAADGQGSTSRHANLSNGAYAVQVRDIGTGVSTLNDRAVTRWSGDEVLDTDGVHFYLRDLNDGSIWSAGFQPTCVIPAEYEFSSGDECAEISRLDFGIACRMRVCVGGPELGGPARSIDESIAKSSAD